MTKTALSSVYIIILALSTLFFNSNLIIFNRYSRGAATGFFSDLNNI